MYVLFSMHVERRMNNGQFVGDIGQPLHDEALELGGNDISAVCLKKSTNLHAAWGAYTTTLPPPFR